MAKAVWLKQGIEKCYPSPYWPIGSIYISTVNQDPSIYFGGTWEALPGDYYLITTPSSQSAIGTGGSWYTEDTALTVDQMPAHNHAIPYNTGNGGYASNSVISAGGTAHDTQGSSAGGAWFTWTENKGDGQGHNHKYQPPYYQVWAWKRIS